MTPRVRVPAPRTRRRGWSPRTRCTSTSLRRKKEGVEDWIDASVEKIGAVPTLNQVLLPAMKEVGDKFGAGELILPFVLQSAEVMKKAVARLENYLDKLEGYTKGTVVIATVFGDVHDIGKSLVNTILTNNGYTVIDLGKQVPISAILDAAVEHDATAIGLSALLVSTSKQMPACVQELHERGLSYPVLIGGAAINRNFGLRILYPGGTASDEQYAPGVFYCKDAFEGLAKMDQLVDTDAREALVSKTRDAARTLREAPVAVDEGAPAVDDASVRSAASVDVEVPEPPFWGAREIDVPLSEIYPHLDTHVLFKLHWGGRGSRARPGTSWWAAISSRGWERMWRDQDYLRPRALVGYFPCNSEGNSLVVWDPEDFDPARPRELERLVFPRQPRHDRICLADFYRPIGSGVDVVAFQAVTRRRCGDRADGVAWKPTANTPSSCSFTDSVSRPPRGWRNGCTPECDGSWGPGSAQGRRYSWGYPSCPEQSELEKVFRLLDAPQIGLRPQRRLRPGARAVDPRDHRPPSPGDLLHDEVRSAHSARADRRRRGDRREPPGPDAAEPRSPMTIRSSWPEADRIGRVTPREPRRSRIRSSLRPSPR